MTPGSGREIPLDNVRDDHPSDYRLQVARDRSSSLLLAMSDMPPKPNVPPRPLRHTSTARGPVGALNSASSASSSSSSASPSRRAPPVPPKTSRVIDQYHADQRHNPWASSRNSVIPVPQRAILAQQPPVPRSRAQPRAQAFSTHQAHQRQEQQLGLITRRPASRVAQMLAAPSPQRSDSASSSGSGMSFGSLAKSVLTAAGGYVANTVVGTDKPRGPGKETIFLVPGWGVKRPTPPTDDNELAFDLHVTTSGLCVFERDPGNVSRTQRAMMSLVRRFAALPAIPSLPPQKKGGVLGDEMTDSPTSEPADDKDLPEINDMIDLSTPPGSPKKAKPAPPPKPKALRGNTLPHHDSEDAKTTPPPSTRDRSDSPPPRFPSTDQVFLDQEQLKLAHEYLDTRLRPFWSTALPNRRVALSLYTVKIVDDKPVPEPGPKLFAKEPLMRTTFTTNSQGVFIHHFVIPWERICTHPESVGLAFSEDPANKEAHKRWGLVFRAQLLGEEGPDGLQRATTTDSINSVDSGSSSKTARVKNKLARAEGAATSFFSRVELPNRNDGDGEQEMGLMGLGEASAEAVNVANIQRPGGVRIISDLDDTVKHSDILSGPREVFRNVFCRRLEDILVHGMNQLYQDLTKDGLSGIHFVSNSPVSIYPLVSQFLQLHKFPSFYSLKLKMYSSRSIVTSLFEGAGDRKRPPIEEIMDEFGDSKFLMFGDSGEQDLELYVQLARERPKQVLAIFIRDVTSGRAEEARRVAAKAGLLSNSELEENDAAAQRQAEHGEFNSGNTAPDRSAPSASSTPSAPSSPTGSGASTPTSLGRQSTDQDMRQTINELQSLSTEEQKVLKRAAQWETRINKALDDVPPNVKLIFFQEPDEIESVAQALVEANV